MITANDSNILIFGDIAYGDDVDLLAAVSGGLKPILLSSCGGEFYVAQRMLTILDGLEGVQIHCVGEVMSAATMLLCAKGATVTSDAGCVFLVHGGSLYGLDGNQAVIERASAEIALVNDAMLKVMSRRMDPLDVSPMLSVDAIFGATRAKELGLVDSVDVPASPVASGSTYRMVASASYIRLQAALTAAKIIEEVTMEEEKKSSGVEELEDIDLEEDEEEIEASAGIEEDAEEAIKKLRDKLLSLKDKQMSRVSQAVLSIYQDGHLSASDTILRLFDILQEEQDEALSAVAASPVHVAAKRVKVKPAAKSTPPISWEGWR